MMTKPSCPDPARWPVMTYRTCCSRKDTCFVTKEMIERMRRDGLVLPLSVVEVENDFIHTIGLDGEMSTLQFVMAVNPECLAFRFRDEGDLAYAAVLWGGLCRLTFDGFSTPDGSTRVDFSDLKITSSAEFWLHAACCGSLIDGLKNSAA